MRRLAVERKVWLSTEAFEEGVSLCQTVPGATAMQCAAYVGLRTRGLAGAVASYVGFGLPAFAFMLGASLFYARAANLLVAQAALRGLRLIVVAIIASAAIDFAHSYLKRRWDWLVALVAALLLVVDVSPILVVGLTALTGALAPREVEARPADSSAPIDPWRAVRRVLLLLAIAAVLVAALFATRPRLADLALVTMKIDVLAFGGGFSALPLMFHEMVDVRRWLPASTFMDGIVLGQVTPGPIVITTTFVGFQTAGVLGALVGTAGTFFPSFAIVVAVAPVFERLRQFARFRAMMRGALGSFVGLLFAVTLQFGRSASWSVAPAAIAVAALVALRLKVDILWVVLAGGVLSVAVGIVSLWAG